MTRRFLPRFKSEILRLGEHAKAVIANEGKYELRYVPFEHVNRDARLVFVGITPGRTQISLSYEALRKALVSGAEDEEALVSTKAAGAFGGGQMRDRLNSMVARFRIHEVIGASSPEEIWDQRLGNLHATSVVPHAAFKNGKMFNGPFSEVLRVPLLRTSFELDFLPTLHELSSDALFVAIGPTPWDALRWCADNGHVGHGQILGALAHPSGSGGSQVDYFIGRKQLDQLSADDPVRHRVDWLDRARAALERSVDHLLKLVPPQPESAGSRLNGADQYGSVKSVDAGSRPSPRQASRQAEPVLDHHRLHALVKRGKSAGLSLFPHLHADGCYVVSLSRYQKDYVRVRTIDEVIELLARGYSLRMSNPDHPQHRSPSLIAPGSIIGKGRMV